MGRRFAFPAGLSCLTQAPPRAFRFDRGAPTPESFRFVADNPAQIAAASDGAARRFEGTAYSGDKITGHWYWGDVVFDLSKTSAPQKLPMLLGHDNDKVVGFSDSVAITNDIKVAGALSRVTEEGKQVAALSDEGFPWQMSVRIEPARVDEIGAGEKVTVNGRTFAGPINVFRNSVIREISFTPTGWDAKTSATAMARGQHQEDVEMDPKELEKLQAQAAQSATFEASAKAEKEAREKAEADKAAAEAKVAEFEAANAKAAKDKREADVKKLFADCRLALTDATAKPYVEMTEEVFAAIATQMRASAKQANPDLFREQAMSGASGGEVDANALAAKAKELIFAAEQKGVSLDAVEAVKQAKVLLLGAGA